MNEFDGSHDGKGFLATFTFDWRRPEKRLVISKKGQRALQNYTQERGGVGCGKPIFWLTMSPVQVPKEFNCEQPPVTVDDIKSVPRNYYRVVNNKISGWLDNLRKRLRGMISRPFAGVKRTKTSSMPPAVGGKHARQH